MILFNMYAPNLYPFQTSIYINNDVCTVSCLWSCMIFVKVMLIYYVKYCIIYLVNDIRYKIETEDSQ